MAYNEFTAAWTEAPKDRACRIKERQNRIVWILLWIWHHFNADTLFIKK